MNRAQQYIEKYEIRIENCEHTSLYRGVLMDFMDEILRFESKFPRELSVQLRDLTRGKERPPELKFEEERGKIVRAINELAILLDKHKADKEER